MALNACPYAVRCGRSCRQAALSRNRITIAVGISGSRQNHTASHHKPKKETSFHLVGVPRRLLWPDPDDLAAPLPYMSLGTSTVEEVPRSQRSPPLCRLYLN